MNEILKYLDWKLRRGEGEKGMDEEEEGEKEDDKEEEEEEEDENIYINDKAILSEYMELPLDLQNLVLTFLKTRFLFLSIRLLNRRFARIVLKPIVHCHSVIIPLRSLFDLSKIPLSIFSSTKRIKIIYDPPINEDKFKSFPIIVNFFELIQNTQYLETIDITMNLFLAQFNFKKLVTVWNRFRNLERIVLRDHRISEYFSFRTLLCHFKNFSNLKSLDFRSNVMMDMFQSVHRGKKEKDLAMKLFYNNEASNKPMENPKNEINEKIANNDQDEKSNKQKLINPNFQSSFHELKTLNICPSHLENQRSVLELNTFCEKNPELEETKLVFVKPKNMVKKLWCIKRLQNLKKLNIINCITMNYEDEEEVGEEEIENDQQKKKKRKKKEKIGFEDVSEIEQFENIKILRVTNSFGDLSPFLRYFDGVEKLIIRNSLIRIDEEKLILERFSTGLKELEITWNRIFIPPKYYSSTVYDDLIPSKLSNCNSTYRIIPFFKEDPSSLNFPSLTVLSLDGKGLGLGIPNFEKVFCSSEQQQQEQKPIMFPKLKKITLQNLSLFFSVLQDEGAQKNIKRIEMFSKCKDLRTIHLQNCVFQFSMKEEEEEEEDRMIEFFVSLQKLRKLKFIENENLTENKLKCSILINISNLSTLESSRNENFEFHFFNEQKQQQQQQQQHLEIIKLVKCDDQNKNILNVCRSILEDTVAYPRKFENLRILNLNGNGIEILMDKKWSLKNEDNTSSSFGGSVFLEEIHLEDNKIEFIDFEVLRGLEHFKNLKIFDICGNPAYDTCLPSCFSSLKNEQQPQQQKYIKLLMKGLDKGGLAGQGLKSGQGGPRFFWMDRILELNKFVNVYIFRIKKNPSAIGSILRMHLYCLVLEKSSGMCMSIRRRLVVNSWYKKFGRWSESTKKKKKVSKIHYYNGNRNLMNYVGMKSKEGVLWIEDFDFEKNKSTHEGEGSNKFDYGMDLIDLEKKFIEEEDEEIGFLEHVSTLAYQE